MTDTLSAERDTQRILNYTETLAKESRKALSVEFNQKHKGLAFNTMPQLLRDSLLAWFARRDKNMKLTTETTNSATLGEVRVTFKAEYKIARFKLQADAKFTMAGGSAESACYLKELNVRVAS